MGLFDRLKKAFTGEQPEEPKQDATALNESTSEESQPSTSDDGSVTSNISESVNTEEPKDELETDASAPIEEQKTPVEVQSNEITSENNEVAEHNEIVQDEAIEPEVHEIDDNDINEEETVSEETTMEEIYDAGLTKSRQTFGQRLNALFANFRSVDEAFFDELEEMLIGADVGFEVAMEISEKLRNEVKLQNAKSKKDVSRVIVETLVDSYGEEGTGEDNQLHYTTNPDEPTVFLFVGVNGVGKTTTIGKLAHRYQQAGKKVLLVAGDTFRAGAIEQLVEWGKRVNVPVVSGKPEGDPAAVVFDGVKRAKAEHFDILLVDTAGRLQNKVNLMNELEKMKRVITRELPDAPQEVLLVLDATTGQNALVQAKQFQETTQVTGIVLTKLDGSARGGIVLAIRQEMHLPVKLVGLGEKMDDLRDFDPNAFIVGLFKGLIEID